MVWKLDALPAAKVYEVGGKARTLAWMSEAGFPVPRGFVIGADAFAAGELKSEAWERINSEIEALRENSPNLAFAVRSSALEEDSQTASFAGEFESLLNVQDADEIRRAITAVYESQFSERVAAYRTAAVQSANPGPASTIAIIVQEMVPAIYAGVLFTADPVSGSDTHMIGNYVHGLGEQLVSGEADGEAFTLKRPSGAYEGPAQMQPAAQQLYDFAVRLEDALGGPQDIEWAVDEAGLQLLQSRPITTMQAYDPATGVWNDSRRGDYLWSNSNFGEAFPDVMTPLTWSQVQMYAEETFDNPLPGDHPFFGNIGGRLYVNLSLYKSLFEAFGYDRERMNYESEEFFGSVPEGLDIPDVPVSRIGVLRGFLPYAGRTAVRRLRNLRALKRFTADLPGQTAVLQKKIEAVETPAALLALWRGEFEPVMRKAYQMLQAGTSRYENAHRPLRRQLVEQVGAQDANLLLSDVSVPGDYLASLGPLIGLQQVADRELSREDYLAAYGHRGPHEMELSIPRPAEDEGWLDAQLASLAESDVTALLAGREKEQREAWQRYEEAFPKEASKTAKKLAAAAEAARGREAIRSEETRLYGLNRSFALKAGAFSGLGDDVFFLWLDELLALLEGDDSGVAAIPLRKRAHERLSALPPYPALISGRFDPERWAADPNRRSDLYDVHQDSEIETAAGDEAVIRGYPGSAGIAEGRVRVLRSSEEGHLLLPGEILVATTTNVGWTPLFPRAAAVVTDIGAPLSHAAIVARELGVPAVVGTGEATMRLQTGDLVRVDGAKGTVVKLA